MSTEEHGRGLRRRLADELRAAIEWDATGTFRVALHTHPPGDPCPAGTCGGGGPTADDVPAVLSRGEVVLPPREHGPHYCAGCGTVWYSRAPDPDRCPICGAATTAAAGASFTVPLAQASPENLAAATGQPARGPSPDAVIYDEPPAYARGGLVESRVTWSPAQLTALLATMLCGDPADTARAFCSRHSPAMVYGRPATLVVFEVAADVEQAQPVERCDPGGGIRPWSGGPGAAPFGVALMDAAAGSLAVIAVTDAGFRLPGEVVIPAGTVRAAALGSTRAGPDEATIARAVEYGEDAWENAAEARRCPAELDTLADAEPLLMAAVPGPEYFAWRHAGPGIWVARPGAQTADVPPGDPAAAVLTTAAEVRTLLHAKGETAR